MFEKILGYLTESLVGNAALGAMAIWAFGLFSRSAAYQKVRAWLGKASFQAGAALSGLATSKLGRPTWGPFEAALTDYAGFSLEQFMAGLRSDNVEKLEAQVERLEAVGSVTRAAALEEKVEALRPTVGRHAERRR